MAGTNAGKRYVAHQELLNGCSDSTQSGTFLDRPREQIREGLVPEALQAHEPFTYTTPYPTRDKLPSLTGEVYLYSPWTLDGQWRGGVAAAPDATRLLVIEPHWFDRFPVAEHVMNFVVAVAKTQVPSIQVVVNNIEDIDVATATAVYSRAYPAIHHWPGTQDDPPRLFPAVSGYYPSFLNTGRRASKRANGNEIDAPTRQVFT